MVEGAGPESDRKGASPAGAELSVAELFGILWDELAELLGSAATATLLRRAARRAARRNPELAELRIERMGLLFGYRCPPGWRATAGDAPAVLLELVAELRPLLVDMTGQIVLQHLEKILELRALLLAAQEKSS